MADITFEWKGARYTVREARAFDLAMQVEDVVTLGEIGSWGPTGIRYAKLCAAFGVMLRFAGAKVSDGDLHREIMGNLAKGGAEAAVGALAALQVVLMAGAPLEDMAAAADEGEGAEKTSA